jgi:hypothetical protein
VDICGISTVVVVDGISVLVLVCAIAVLDALSLDPGIKMSSRILESSIGVVVGMVAVEATAHVLRLRFLTVFVVVAAFLDVAPVVPPVLFACLEVTDFVFARTGSRVQSSGMWGIPSVGRSISNDPVDTNYGYTKYVFVCATIKL